MTSGTHCRRKHGQEKYYKSKEKGICVTPGCEEKAMGTIYCKKHKQQYKICYIKRTREKRYKPNPLAVKHNSFSIY